MQWLNPSWLQADTYDQTVIAQSLVMGIIFLSFVVVTGMGGMVSLAQATFVTAGGFAGGWAMLGERGPELARLPGGTDVFTAAQSRDLLASGSGRSGPLIGSQTIYGVAAGDVERETRRALRRAALAWSLGGT